MAPVAWGTPSGALVPEWSHAFRFHSPIGDGVVGATADDLGSGLLLATLAGAATALGALALPLLPPDGPPPNAMAFAMSLAGGVMLAVSAEMLWPHMRWDGWAYDRDPFRPLLLFCISALACLACCRLGDAADKRYAGHGAADAAAASLPPPSTLPEGDERVDGGREHSARLAVLLFVALTAHNIPEGFAVAVSALSGRSLGVSICIAVALHNIPEGLTLAVTTLEATRSRAKAALAAIVAGFAEPVGALFAVFVLRSYVTAQLVDDLLVAVGGVMCCIALAELLPEAIATRCFRASAAGLVCGLLVMFLTHLALEETAEASASHGHDHDQGHAHK